MGRHVDERVVQMEFDNDRFQKRISETITSMKNLDQSMQFKNGEKGFSKVQKAAGSLKMDGAVKEVGLVETALLKLQSTGTTVFNALSGVAGTATKAFGLVTAALNTGIVAKSIQGGLKRASNIGQAKFQLGGLGVAWDDIKEDLNYAVDNTAYGLDAAAVTASSLVASGVEVGDQMKQALRAVSGVAAMTGREYGDIGSIFTTVAGQGQVMTMQLRQLEMSGMNAAATIAKFFREVRGESEMTEAQIREMVSDGEIDFNTFAEAMNWAFGAHAAEANETFSGALANIGSALSRTTADFFEAVRGKNGMVPIFNDLRLIINDLNNEMFGLMRTKTDDEGVEHYGAVIEGVTGTLKQVHKALDAARSSLSGPFGEAMKATEPIVAGFFNWFNRGVDDIVWFGTDMFKIFSQLHRVAMTFLKPVGEAFAEVFGINSFAEFGQNLRDMTARFYKFISAVKPSEETLNGVKEAAKGVFQGLKTVTDFLGGAFGSAFDAFLNLLQTGSLKLDEFFKSLSPKDNGLGDAVKELSIIDHIGNLFESAKNKVLEFWDAIQGKMAFSSSEGSRPIDQLSESIKGFFESWGMKLDLPTIQGAISIITSSLSTLFTVLTHAKIQNIMNKFMGIPQQFTLFINNFKRVPATFNELVGSLTDGITRLSKGFSRKQTAEAVKEMAKSLLMIAGAVAILAMIDQGQLAGAMAALIGIATVLTFMTSVLPKIAENVANSAADFKSTFKTGLMENLITTALIPLALSLVGMAAAMALIATIPEDRIGDALACTMLLGLTAAGMLVVMAAVGNMMQSGAGAKALAGSLAMIPLIGATMLLGLAMQQFAGMEFQQAQDGMERLAIAMFVLVGLTSVLGMYSGGAIRGAFAALVLTGTMFLIYDAVKKFGSLSASQITKATDIIGKLMAALIILSLAFAQPQFEKGLAAVSASIGGLAFAFSGIAQAIVVLMKATEGDSEKLENTFTTLGIGLIALTVALGVLASIPDAKLLAAAGAMLVMSASLVVMAAAIKILSTVDLLGAIKGLGLFVATMLLLAGMAAVFDALLGVILPFLVVVGAFSLSMVALGASFYLFITALVMAANLTEGALVSMVYSFVAAARAISANAQDLIQAAFVIGSGLAAALWGAIDQSIDRVTDIIGKLIIKIAQGINEHGDEIKDAGKKVGALIIEAIGEAIMELGSSIWNWFGQAAATGNPDLDEFQSRLDDELGVVSAEEVKALNQKFKDEAAEHDFVSGVVDQVNANIKEHEGEISDKAQVMGEEAVQGINEGAEQAAANQTVTDIFGAMNFDELSDLLQKQGMDTGAMYPDSIFSGMMSGGSIDFTQLFGSEGLGLSGSDATAKMTDMGKNLGLDFNTGLSQSFSGEDAPDVGQSVIDNLNGQSDNFKTAGESNAGSYTDGFNDAVQKINPTKDIVSELQDTVSYAHAGQSAGSAYGGGLVAALEEYSYTGIVNSAITLLLVMVPAYLDAGQQSGRAYTQGVATGFETQVVKTATTQLLETMKMVNESLVRGKAVGSSMSKGVASGISSGAASARSAMSGLINSAGNAGSPYGNGFSLGWDMARGVAAGIRSGTYLASSAARKMVSDAYDAGKKESESHSPSKLFARLGNYMGQGYALGIDQSAPLGAEAAKSMVRRSADALSDALHTASNMVTDTDWGADPVITPVLDLSEFESGIARMDRMSTDNQVLSAGYANRRVFSKSGSERKIQNGAPIINMTLQYDAGTSAKQLFNDLASHLETLNLMEA